jgi:hypothetical protein
MRRCLGMMLVAAWAVAAVAGADQPKTGTEPGNVLPGPFRCYTVTGARAGKFHDFVTEYGLDPTVAVFFREPIPSEDQPLGKLLRQLNASVGGNRGGRLHAFAVLLALKDEFLKDDNRGAMIDGLEKLSAKLSLQNVPLGLERTESEQTKRYNIPVDATVTILVYNNQIVQARFAFGADKPFDEAAVSAVMAEVGKLSGKKK